MYGLMHSPKNTTDFHDLGVFLTPGVRPMTEMGSRKELGSNLKPAGNADTELFATFGQYTVFHRRTCSSICDIACVRAIRPISIAETVCWLACRLMYVVALTAKQYRGAGIAIYTPTYTQATRGIRCTYRAYITRCSVPCVSSFVQVTSITLAAVPRGCAWTDCA